MTENQFLKIAKIFKPDFNEGRSCPDQIVGSIKVTDGKIHNPSSNCAGNDFLERINLPSNLTQTSRNIILILESPHIKEFEGAPRPAAGNGPGEAGYAIRNLFSAVCSIHELSNGNYSLILMNAIQYQCSLGNINKYRDNVFIKCWSEFAENNFLDRLTEIYKKDDLIINACTVGNNKELKLRTLVGKSISKINPTSVLTLEHPASWARTNNSIKKYKTKTNFGQCENKKIL